MKKIIYKFLLGIVFIVGCGDDDTTNSTIDPLVGNWNQTHYSEVLCEELDSDCSALIVSDPSDVSCGPYATFAENGTFTYSECCFNDQTNDVTSGVMQSGTWEVSGDSVYTLSYIGFIDGVNVPEIFISTIDGDGVMTTTHDHCTYNHPDIVPNCLGAKFIKGIADCSACTESCTED